MNHAQSEGLRGISKPCLFIVLIVFHSDVTCYADGHIKIGRELQDSTLNIKWLKIKVTEYKKLLFFYTQLQNLQGIYFVVWSLKCNF